MSPRKSGRPTSYRDDYAEQAKNLCLLGATDADLARSFGVCEATLNTWKRAHPEFLESLKAGKEEADARIADSLFRRALGYEHDAVKIVVNTKTGAEYIVPYTERYPPDTTAAIFWLKNRRPDLWRDRQHVEHSGRVDSGVLAVPGAVDGITWVAGAIPQQAALRAQATAAADAAEATYAPKRNGANGNGHP